MTNLALPPRPGSDWLRPETTTRPRVRPLRAKLAVVVASALIGGAGALVWLGTGQVRRDEVPLSFRLQERAPEESGIVFAHAKGAFAPFFDNVLPFMNAVSAGGCTGDVDNDGDLDLFLTTAGDGERNALFLNDGTARFSRAELPVLDGRNGKDGFTTECAFVDVDDDGRLDLYWSAVAQRPRLFRNVSEHGALAFADVSARAGLPDYMNGFAAVFFDPDADGDLDLLLASYFAETYREEDVPGAPRIHTFAVPEGDGAGRMMPNNWGNATNGGRKHFLLNDGTGTFAEQDLAAWGLSETRFTFDIGTGDVDQDGYTDVYFANDFGPDQLYLNDHGKRFVAQAGSLPTDIGHDAFKGMNAELADIDGDSFPELYVTNVFHPVLPEGNILWRNTPGTGTSATGAPMRDFQNVAADLGAKDGGWGWGARFVDLDLDGDKDLVETNGYISQHPDKEYWYRLSRLVAGDRRLIVDTKKWPPFEDRSMSGHQVSHVFVWDGQRFWNRAADAGVTRSFDGRGVVVADFDVDGRPDVVFIAQGAAPLVTRNVFVATAEQPTAPAWVGVRVHGDGTHVTRDAVGTRVVITSAGRAQHFEISAGNTMAAQSMPWVLAGLGKSTAPVDVTVRWPNGVETTLQQLAPGRYHDVTFDAGAAR